MRDEPGLRVGWHVYRSKLTIGTHHIGLNVIWRKKERGEKH